MGVGVGVGVGVGSGAGGVGVGVGSGAGFVLYFGLPAPANFLSVTLYFLSATLPPFVLPSMV